MSKEELIDSRDKQIREAQIQIKTEQMVKSVSSLTELPDDILACGMLADSNEIFVARIKMNKITDDRKQIRITEYDFVIDDVKNNDLMEGLYETYNCPILFDDSVASKIMGNKRSPTRISEKYKLLNGKHIDIYMPKMAVTIH